MIEYDTPKIIVAITHVNKKHNLSFFSKRGVYF